MKTLTNILLIIILGFSCLNLSAQNDTLKQLESKAYTAYINSNVYMWKQLAREADHILNNENADSVAKIEAIKLKYGLLYGCLSNQDKETYEAYLDKTQEQLENLMDEYPESSSLYCISAAIMSVQMGFSPMKGATLGSLSGQHISKSIKLDSLNAMAWRQYASSKYFTPKMWGGDIEEAIKKYKYAISLYEKQNLTQDWVYLDSIVWLGIAYKDIGDNENAKLQFEKALKMAPTLSWVKNRLLPSVSQL